MNKWQEKTCKVIHMEIKLSFVIFRDVILRKSGHIRGAKRPSLSEVPYRQAFENMNEAVHINKASMFFWAFFWRLAQSCHPFPYAFKCYYFSATQSQIITLKVRKDYQVCKAALIKWMKTWSRISFGISFVRRIFSSIPLFLLLSWVYLRCILTD